jgi:hypothetical protein
VGGGQARGVELVGQGAVAGALEVQLDEPHGLMAVGGADGHQALAFRGSANEHAPDSVGEIFLGPPHPGDRGGAERGEEGAVGVAEGNEPPGAGGPRGEELRPMALRVGMRVGVHPHAPRQARAQRQPGRHASGPRKERRGPAAGPLCASGPPAWRQRKPAPGCRECAPRRGPGAGGAGRRGHAAGRAGSTRTNTGRNRSAGKHRQRLSTAWAETCSGATQNPSSCGTRRTHSATPLSGRQMRASPQAPLTGKVRVRARKPRRRNSPTVFSTAG